MDEQVVASDIEPKYTSTGRRSGVQIHLYHKGLNERKHLTGIDTLALEGKIHNQIVSWESKWNKKLLQIKQQSKQEQAEDRTRQAQQNIENLSNILKHTLAIDDTINWDSLKNHDNFGQSSPVAPKADEFFVKIPFLQKILGRSKTLKDQQQKEYDQATVAYSQQLDKWKNDKNRFEDLQKKNNDEVEELKKRYLDKETDAIIEYCDMVLNNSEYPDYFPKTFDIQYNSVNQMLLVDYQLPSLEDIPQIESVKYIKSKNAVEEKLMSKTAMAKLYDDAIYQILLRTLHELFEADSIDAIQSINLNGCVTHTNPATGHKETACISSIQTTKTEFGKINLAAIDSKKCFKSLKGVGSSKLSTMTPVQPIIALDKSDKRIIGHYDVANDLDENLNIAAMDWADFEHLVREIFEKEFVANGGEVHVTQASADGGVDAIAFDPDPLRGGKIVIQAKRYTNVVGVSAVRDLYGTVMNEGATKGILVTTSDYGNDSYEFAKGKPLTLINGANLLHLLEKHGHRAKIDLHEAKKILKEQKS